jgi:hypothetical protein
VETFGDGAAHVSQLDLQRRTSVLVRQSTGGSTPYILLKYDIFNFHSVHFYVKNEASYRRRHSEITDANCWMVTAKRPGLDASAQ